MQLYIRDSKGMESRVTMLPGTLVEPLQEHLLRVKRLHELDLDRGYGAMLLPFALERKYPNAPKEWLWQYVFPSDRLSKDPRSVAILRDRQTGTESAFCFHRGGVGSRTRMRHRPSSFPMGLMPQLYLTVYRFEAFLGCTRGGQGKTPGLPYTLLS